MSKIRYSHIIPVYNTDIDMFQRCLSSIITQGYPSYEIIIVNDGSSDKYIDIFCRNIIQENENIKYLYQENKGSAVARNAGLAIATGDYIIFVDSDDYLDNNFYNEICNISLDKDIVCFDYAFEKDNDYQIYTLKDIIDFSNDKDNIIRNVLLEPDVLDNFMFGALWGKIISKKFIDKNCIKFFPELRKTQDRIFMLQCYIAAKSISYFPVFGYHYCLNEKSITHKYDIKMIDYYQKLNDIVDNICANSNIPFDYKKFFTYGIFIELMQLTFFNKNYKSYGRKLHKNVEKTYELFDFDNVITNLSINNFKSITGKIKYLLLKHHLFDLLKLYFERKSY